MKKRKSYVLLFVGLFLNLLGRGLASKCNCPAFLNVTGTLLIAYHFGPWWAAGLAAVTNLISGCFVETDWYYMVVDLAVALESAMISKRHHYLQQLLSASSIILTLTALKGVLMTAVNIIVFEGKTPMEIANAIYDYLNALGLPYLLQSFTAACYIAFADIFIAILLLFVTGKIWKRIRKIHRAKELKKALGGKVSLGMAVLFLLLSFAQTDTVEAAAHINFVERFYNSENGLTGGTANDIAQTEDGTMWIGTYGGLYRFNGEEFELIDDVDSVRSVHSLYVDSSDRLWVGTNGGGATVINITQQTSTIEETDGLPSNTVKDIIQDTDGTYYMGTTGGLAIATYDGEEITVTSTYTELGSIRDMAENGSGTVAVLNSLGEISLFLHGTLMDQFRCVEGRATGIVYYNGDLYIGTDMERIYRYHYSGIQYQGMNVIETTGVFGVNDMYFDEEYVYLAADTGIGYIDEEGVTRIINSGSFDNSVDEVFKDYQGNLWFTSSRCGLLSLCLSSFVDVFGVCNATESVANVVVPYGDYIYVGTDDGLKILDVKNGDSIDNEVTEAFAGKRIRIMVEKEDSLLIAAYGQELMELTQDGALATYLDAPTEEEKDLRIRFMVVLADGTLLTSGDNGLSFIQNRKVVSTMVPGDVIGQSLILNVWETEDGRLLAGSDGEGIYVIKDGEVVSHITKEDGLSSGVILRIVDDRVGNGYFVLTGSGLCYMNENYQIRELEGLSYFNNYDLYQNEDGNVFVIGGAGIYVLDYENLMSESGITNYALLDQKSGLPGSLTSNAWNYVNAEGILYVCGNTGVYALDMLNYEMEVNTYKSKITAVQLDGKKINITELGEIIIPRGVQKVDFTLEVNNFTTADPRVRYYLTGVDEEKVTALSSEVETITYYMIPYGSHEFHIEMLSDSGEVLSEQIYIVTKNRELYETTYFRMYFFGILILLLFMIGLAVVRGNVQLMVKRQQSAHEKVIGRLEREKTEALERALHMEAEANKTKSVFLANMSHEIRTPINAIIGMDTMILREAEQPVIKKYAKDIEASSHTLLALINDILDFSKIESGNLELVEGEYDLGKLIHDLINMISPKIQEKKLNLELEIQEDMPRYLYGDDVRMQQILLNILNNAVKYTEKGTVTLAMHHEVVEGNEILLYASVSDTGVGIKEEDLLRLFSPYQRLDEQRNKHVEGTGLGMSITQSLLEKMGSRLEVSSEYGMGSTFSFVVPQVARSMEKLGDYREIEASQTSDVTEKEHFHAPEAEILLVDDVEMNLIVAQGLLKRIQVNVDLASSGMKALEMAMHKQYDIILLDSMMPEMSGEETMHAIRSESELNEETPIIVLTAHAVKGAREEYLRMGYTNYLSKPLDSVKLEAMIQSYLPDDKIILLDGTEEEPEVAKTEEPEQEDSFFIQAAKIPEIDLEKGIETAGGQDVFQVICKNFHDTAENRIGMIQEYYDAKDIHNYTIQVHALKSTARLVGAYHLSEEALELENAGRNEDWDYIQEKTEGVLQEYQKLFEEFHEIFLAQEELSLDDSGKEPITPEMREDAFRALKELCQMMDYDGTEMVLHQLEEYALQEDDRDFLEKAKKALKTFDWDALENLLLT